MWLLEGSVLERLDKAMKMFEGTHLELEAVVPNSGLSTVDSGQVAVIAVDGILTKEPDSWIAFFFGKNTAYDDIIGQLAAAEADPNVKGIRLDIDSPGGNADGLFDTLSAIDAVTKPMSVLARKAQSAAYGIAAAAGGIVATGPGAEFGSVGVAVSIFVDEAVVTLTSTGAPEKRPDPRTEEGRASIVRELDAIDDLFVDAIANGRGVSMDAVRQGFGRGASFLAGEAERRGMIDGIAGAGLRVVGDRTQATADGGSEECMDLDKLKAEHPAVYKAAVEVGVNQERDRVVAHLKLGESGDMKTALIAVKDGADITQTTYAAHMSAALNRRDVKARDDDNKVVEGATNGVKPKVDEDSFQKAVTDRFIELVGNGGIENG